MVLTRSGCYTNMHREDLEELTLIQLQTELTKLGLAVETDKKKCIDVLIRHHEKKQATGNRKTSPMDEGTESVAGSTPRGSSESLLQGILEKLDRQQLVIDQLISQKIMAQQPYVVPNLMTGVSSIQPPGMPNIQSPGMSNTQLPGMSNIQSPGMLQHSQFNLIPDAASVAAHSNIYNTAYQPQPILAAVPPAQAVSLLASQISPFGGGEDEYVDLWLTQVDQVAEIHGVNDGVKLLAATSKLNKHAREWYLRKNGPALRTWALFREAFSKAFHRYLSFQDMIQKVQARRWNFGKETFQEYSTQKLKLMHPMQLPERDCVQLLIGGINNYALRATATALKAHTVDEFLEEMYSITSACSSASKQSSSPPYKKEYTRDSKNIHHNSKDSKEAHRPDSTKPSSPKKEVLTCAYCRLKGHVKADCWKLKRKEQFSTTASGSSASPQVAAAEEVSPSPKDGQPIVGCVEESKRQLQISSSVIEIVTFNKQSCNLFALVDTGSPVSFIKESVCKSFFEKDMQVDKSDLHNFRSLNNSPIEVVGKKKTNIGLKILPSVNIEVMFHIIRNDSWNSHIVLGRDFFLQNKITLVFNPVKSKAEERLQLLREVASADVIEENDSGLATIHTDFGPAVDLKVQMVIKEVENTPVEKVDDDYRVTVQLHDNSIFAYSPRRFAWAERSQVREIIDDLLARGIIKESASPYCSRIIPVRKKNGKLRLCVDLRPLNARVVKQKYPFPVMEELFTRIADKSIRTLVDIKESFHAIKIHPDHTQYFAFATPDGQYEYTRLPFGYSEAPALFQKRLLQILQPLIRQNKILVYIDDILIPSDTVEENLEVLRQVLLLLKKYSFNVNFSKCQFLKTKLEYLGYILSDQGITLSKRHSEAVEKFPVPRNVMELQRFLGLVGYFRKFVKDFAQKAKPLYSLLKKSTAFNFDKQCLEAFRVLKTDLTTFPVLRLYNPRLQTELHTDASSVALAAILLQRQDDKALAPIAFYSQATNSAESRYHSFELEMLAIVKAVERFHVYLYGVEFIIKTDCIALVYAVNKANLNPRIARWVLRLQNYSFKLMHRKGNLMTHVDALSRIVASIDTVPLERELRCRQSADPYLQSIAKALEETEHDKYVLIEGLVYRSIDKKLLFYVPESMITNIIRVYHDDCAHCGLDKTLQGIRDSYWFPSMRRKVKSHIENCITCLMSNTSTNTKEGEIQFESTPQSPFQVMHTDHFGPLIKTTDGFRHVLTLIDAFTRFTWLFPVKSTSSKETINCLSTVFDVFGNPSELVSDRGTAFSSFEFSEFTQTRNIKHRQVAVAAPWANGLSERVNRFLKTSLRKVVDDQSDWSKKLKEVQYAINNTFHSAIKASPAKLLFGIDKCNHLDTDLTRYLKHLSNSTLSASEFEELRHKNRDIALQASDEMKNYNKTYYDKHHKTPSEYKIGDYVMIRDSTVKPGEDRKLKAIYKGPYVVAKTLNKNRYVIQDIPGYNITQKPYNSILSPDRLKRWISSD